MVQVLPSAVVCQGGAHEDITFQVSGQGLDSTDAIILARCNGRYLNVQVLGVVPQMTCPCCKSVTRQVPCEACLSCGSVSTPYVTSSFW